MKARGNIKLGCYVCGDEVKCDSSTVRVLCSKCINDPLAYQRFRGQLNFSQLGKVLETDEEREERKQDKKEAEQRAFLEQPISLSKALKQIRKGLR